MCINLHQIWSARRAIIIIATPIVLLPVPIFYTTTAGRCAYGLLIMAVYWMTEAIPIAATALMPIALFPWLGVASSKVLCLNYFKDTNVLFVGGLMVAVAVEKWNLHKRIALRVLMIVGSRPKWLMFGFMITTAFLSMWISNTATTAMMVPIAQAVINELDKHRQRLAQLSDDDKDAATTANDMELISSTEPLKGVAAPHIYRQVISEVEVNPETEIEAASVPPDKKFKELRKGLTLCICYAANVGGTATLTGTGPNLVLKGIVDTLYEGESGISFSTWFIFAFPNMLLCLLAAWLWLQLMFLGKRELFSCCYKGKLPENDGVNQVIRNEYNKLGPMSFAEKAVLGHFIFLALLWLTREPEIVPGWAYLFKDGYVTDASVACSISLLLFMFPSSCPRCLCCKSSESRLPSDTLLDWHSVQHNLAWGIVLVLGGGFALADACKISGLSSDISELFTHFQGVSPWIIVLVLCVVTATFTEVTSNVATTTIFLPILAEVARSTHINPLYLMIAVTVSASFAFMLPVATPPNAIVFAYGHMKISDMVKAGVVMNLICIGLLQLAMNTWGYAYFNMGQYPSWAGNLTLLGNKEVNGLTTTPGIDFNGSMTTV